MNQKIGTRTLALWAFCSLAAVASDEKSLNLKNGLALQGYDPVSYFQSAKPLEGKTEFKAKVGSATYQFATAANLEEFKKNPARYEPQYGGWCAYAMADGELVSIDPQTFKIVDHKLLLFYNGWLGNTLPKWNKNEVELHRKADAAWEKLLGDKK